MYDILLKYKYFFIYINRVRMVMTCTVKYLPDK